MVHGIIQRKQPEISRGRNTKIQYLVAEIQLSFERFYFIENFYPVFYKFLLQSYTLKVMLQYIIVFLSMSIRVSQKNKSFESLCFVSDFRITSLKKRPPKNSNQLDDV